MLIGSDRKQSKEVNWDKLRKANRNLDHDGWLAGRIDGLMDG